MGGGDLRLRVETPVEIVVFRSIFNRRFNHTLDRVALGSSSLKIITEVVTIRVNAVVDVLRGYV